VGPQLLELRLPQMSGELAPVNHQTLDALIFNGLYE
jgi:hypothetical protein